MNAVTTTPYADLPDRTYILSRPDERADEDEIDAELERQLSSLPWERRHRLLRRFERGQRDDLR